MSSCPYINLLLYYVPVILNDKFIYLINILILKVELKTFSYDIILNYHLS